jgi:hypothetical protein
MADAMRVVLRPTIASDLAQVTHEPLPFRIQAITALAEDKVLGIGGIGFRPDGVVIGFAALNEEFRRYPRALHRAGLAMMKVIRESGVPQVLAIADDNVEPATRWLERLGFKMRMERGVKLFVWSAYHG